MLRLIDPLEEFDRPVSSFGGRERGRIMPMDACDLEGLYTLRFDLPGLDPGSVDVTIEDTEPAVTALGRREDAGSAAWLLRAHPAGAHRGRIRLGASNVHAGRDNGVRSVTSPLRDGATPVEVAVSSGDSENSTTGPRA